MGAIVRKFQRKSACLALCAALTVLATMGVACNPEQPPGCGTIVSGLRIEGYQVGYSYSTACNHSDIPLLIERFQNGVWTEVARETLYTYLSDRTVRANFCKIGIGSYRGHFVKNGADHYTATKVVTIYDYQICI